MICGKKVTLGPILPGDFPALFRWSDDFDAALLNETYRPAIWKSQEEFWFNSIRDSSKVYFAIRKLGSQAIAGYVQISNIDAVHRSALLGVRIGEAADRGHGYGGEAVELAVRYCWNQLNLSRLSLLVFAGNEHAIRLYRAAGFRTEGQLAQALFIDGAWIE
jgi:RimJ/RimL family protein N-acetyltransferase